MKARSNPKCWMIREIRRDHKKVGMIKLVSYLTNKSIPHLEFEIEEAYRHQGIMTKELPKYLKECKKWGHNRLIAIVKKDNWISRKILEKNNFIKFADLESEFCYIIDIEISQNIKNFYKHIMKNISYSFNC